MKGHQIYSSLQSLKDRIAFQINAGCFSALTRRANPYLGLTPAYPYLLTPAVSRAPIPGMVLPTTAEIWRT